LRIDNHLASAIAFRSAAKKLLIDRHVRLRAADDE